MELNRQDHGAKHAGFASLRLTCPDSARGAATSMAMVSAPPFAPGWPGLFLTGLLLTLLLGAIVPLRGASADEPIGLPTATSISSDESNSPANSELEELKQKSRLVVDTNLPPASSNPNGAPGKKSFSWKFKWQGWEGLYVAISQKTPVHWRHPIMREGFGFTNAFPRISLEETKMEGRLGARVALDAAAFRTSGNLDGFDDGGQLRRLRVFAKGNCLLLLPVAYELELGYVPGGFYMEDSYVAFENLWQLGELKIGQFQPPMSLEAMASSRDITFMESAAPVEALAPGVNAGFRLGRSVFSQRATWALGLFSEGVGQDGGDASKNYGRAIGRITWLPWYQQGDPETSRENLLHLGVSGNYLYSASGAVRYQSRPESHLSPVVIDTGYLNANWATVVDLEAAWVAGPLSVQGEFLNAFVDEQSGATLRFHGFYGYASWFLTGESRPYDRETARFTRVRPLRDFSFTHGGLGAWELGARVSYTTLNDDFVTGGRLALLTGGVTWYPNANIRWKFNYLYGEVDDKTPSGRMNIFETRIEVDF